MKYDVAIEYSLSTISWQYYPKSEKIPEHLSEVIKIFEHNENEITSSTKELKSDYVLSKLRTDLLRIGFEVEKSKKDLDKIKIPVLFGLNGKLEKSFDADAFDSANKTVIEIEAGRGVTNFQFLKDLFQACMMLDTDYLTIAVRKIYLKKHRDFQTVVSFFDTLYASQRIKLPLKGILIIGY